MLRGIFLGRQKEVDWTFEGKGANFLFPKEWEEYQAFIPKDERDNYKEAYGRRLRGELGEEGEQL